MSLGMGGEKCHLCGGRQVFEINKVYTNPNKHHGGGDGKVILQNVGPT
jgi:hypothetical protein